MLYPGWMGYIRNYGLTWRKLLRIVVAEEPQATYSELVNLLHNRSSIIKAKINFNQTSCFSLLLLCYRNYIPQQTHENNKHDYEKFKARQVTEACSGTKEETLIFFRIPKTEGI